MTITCITMSQAHDAALAACREVWRKAHGGNFDKDCPAQAQWIAEELDALLPALDALGITVRDAMTVEEL